MKPRTTLHVGEVLHCWTIIEPGLHLSPNKQDRKHKRPGLSAALVECSCLDRPRRLIATKSLITGKSRHCGGEEHAMRFQSVTTGPFES